MWRRLGHEGGRLAVYASLFPFLAVAAGFVAAWAQSARRTWGLLMAMLAGTALMLTAHPRPQLVPCAAFACGLWTMQQTRQQRWRSLWLFLAIIPVWANLHASVVQAPALLLNETLGISSPPLKPKASTAHQKSVPASSRNRYAMSTDPTVQASGLSQTGIFPIKQC